MVKVDGIMYHVTEPHSKVFITNCNLVILESQHYQPVRHNSLLVRKSISDGVIITKCNLAILDSRKLSYIGRIIRTPPGSVVKQVFMTRAYDCITANAERKIKMKGFLPEVFEICKKYEMFEFIDIYLKGGTFLGKRQWASIYKHYVKSAGREVWLQNLQIKDDCPLASLSIIGPHPHILWKIAKSDITMQHSCTEAIKLLAIPLSANSPVCCRCGAIMVYRPVHVLMECSFLNVYRQSLRDDIVDLLDVSFSVDLFLKDDLCALSIMLGGFWDMYRNIEKIHLIIVYKQQCQTYQTYDWCLWTETDIWIGRSRGPVLIWPCHFSDVGSHCRDGIVIRPSCLHDGIFLCWWPWDGVILSCLEWNGDLKALPEQRQWTCLPHYYALDIIEMGHRSLFLSW